MPSWNIRSYRTEVTPPSSPLAGKPVDPARRGPTRAGGRAPDSARAPPPGRLRVLVTLKPPRDHDSCALCSRWTSYASLRQAPSWNAFAAGIAQKQAPAAAERAQMLCQGLRACKSSESALWHAARAQEGTSRALVRRMTERKRRLHHRSTRHVGATTLESSAPPMRIRQPAKHRSSLVLVVPSMSGRRA